MTDRETKLLELRPFTCANDGNVAWFNPRDPNPCVECHETRWILGIDTKLFEWKASLATERPREQVAALIRKTVATLLADPDDPIIAALVDVQNSGFVAAAELQECGHSKGDLRDGACIACQKESALTADIDNQRTRADSLVAELDRSSRSAAASAVAEKSALARMESVTEELGRANQRVELLLGAESELLRVSEQAEMAAARNLMLDQEVASLRRELEGMDAALAQARKSESALIGVNSALDDALCQLADARRARETAEKKAQELSRRIETLDQACAQAKEKIDAGVAHVIEMKQTHETLIEHAAKARIRLDDENKELRTAAAGLERERDALKKEQDEGWLRKDRIVELETTSDRLGRQLETALAELTVLRNEQAVSIERKNLVLQFQADNEQLARDVGNARADTAAKQKQLDELWLSKDLVVQLEGDKARLTRELEAATAEMARLAEKGPVQVRVADPDVLAANDALARELAAAKKKSASLRKEIDEGWLGKDRVIELERTVKRLTGELNVATTEISALTKERDDALRSATRLAELEGENLDLLRRAELATRNEAILRKELSEGWLGKDRVVELEADTARLSREIAAANAEIGALGRERDAGAVAMEKLAAAEDANARLVRQLAAANGQLDAIREKLGA
jgi:myosin heavy subunit